MQYKTGKRSVQKGKRGERELARLLEGKRVPLSGALDGLPNDVVLPGGWRAEVKTRRKGLARIYKALEGHEIVLYKNADTEGLYAMRADIFHLVLQGVVTRKLNGVIHPDKGLRQVRSWIKAEDADVLAFKADRMDWLILVPELTWAKIRRSAPASSSAQG